ncbi:MAG: class I SAM-dependent methyltransferase [Candidatus Hodarchaeota archaeon]
MSKEIGLVIELGRLPFHIGVKPTPSNEDLPDSLPFNVGLRMGINLLVQMPDDEVSKHLAIAYERGSIVGTPMSEGGSGRRYAEDFLGFIRENVNLLNHDGARLLEIGCGNGYLLYRLQSLGFEVLGIEPGGQGQIGARKYGVNIIQDAFPRGMEGSRKKFDIIIHYAVLEHIAEPATFLKRQVECLSESGLIIFAVPDCKANIMSGDISMFLHEHWNYFTPYSVKKVVEMAGLQLLRLENAGYGGSVYTTAARSGKSIDVSEDLDWSLKFEDCVKQYLENTKRFFQEYIDMESSVGIFCPARAINILHLVRPRNTLRFFDDDKLLHGKFYPPFDVPVESREALIERPVDELLIMSPTFGEEIRKTLLKENRLKNTRISLLSEIMNVASANN